MKNYMNMVLFAVTIIFIAACGGGTNQPSSQNNTSESTKTNLYEPTAEMNDVLNKYNCLTCHAPAEKVIGPAFAEVSKRHYADDEIVQLIAKPKPEHWPDYPPMIGLKVPDEDARKIAQWINSLDSVSHKH